MEDEKPVVTENPDEGRGEKRIGEELSEEDLAVFPLFQEDALGAGLEVLAVTDEVFFRIDQVKIMGDALGHRVVDSLVGEEEIVVDGGEVDGQGKPEKKEDDEGEDNDRCSRFAHKLIPYHIARPNSTRSNFNHIQIILLCLSVLVF